MRYLEAMVSIFGTGSINTQNLALVQALLAANVCILY